MISSRPNRRLKAPANLACRLGATNGNQVFDAAWSNFEKSVTIGVKDARGTPMVYWGAHLMAIGTPRRFLAPDWPSVRRRTMMGATVTVVVLASVSWIRSYSGYTRDELVFRSSS